jgi:transposase
MSEVTEETPICDIDETGTNQYLYREYAYAPRGEKVTGKVKGKKYERLSMVAGKIGDKIIGRCEYTGTMTSKLFELWFVRVLLPLLSAGSVIRMDNASFHRKKVLKRLAEAVGCRIIFFPPYSPDLNPIEKVWANFKKFLKHYLSNYSNVSEAALAFSGFA